MLRKFFPIVGLVLLLPIAAKAQSVTVQPGDTLSRIAARELGNGNRWTELCELNRSALKGGCDRLVVGSLVLLRAPPESEIAVAEVDTPAPQLASETVATTASADLVPVTAFDPQLIGVRATDEHLEDQDVLSGTVAASAGEHRIRYGFSTEGKTKFNVEWLIQTDLASKPLITVFGNSSDVIGRVYFVSSDQVTSDGAITAASIATESGWSAVKFAIAAPNDAFVQVLFYPVGASENPLDAETNFRFLPPQVMALTN